MNKRLFNYMKKKINKTPTEMKHFSKLFDFEDKTQVLAIINPFKKIYTLDVRTETPSGSYENSLICGSKKSAQKRLKNFGAKEAVAFKKESKNLKKL
jgi:hypothetical protein